MSFYVILFVIIHDICRYCLRRHIHSETHGRNTKIQTQHPPLLLRFCFLLSSQGKAAIMKCFLSIAAALVTFTRAAPVQVYIMMGQSNMLGEGHRMGMENGTLEFAVKTEHKYPYLWDATNGTWTVSNSVRNVFVMGSGGADASTKVLNNEWLTNGPTNKRKTIGPELGIGGMMEALGGETMLLKSCIGNRALGWDLLPPGSPSFDYQDPKNASLVWTYAGYHQSPARWEKGTTPKPIKWEAGLQYDGDVSREDAVLKDLGTYFPGATEYEVAGFFWWQGDRDSRDMALAEHYETNLVRLINALRTHFKSPKAKFVTASLGQTKMGSTDGGGLILDAMLAVANATKYPEFKGNVAAVYSHPLSMGSSSGSHYGGNAETYMNIGQAMGSAMVKLLKGDE